MLVASLNDLKPIDYRDAFPQTSFSVNGPSDEFLAEMGYAKVNVFRPHDRNTEKLVPCEPVFENGWVYTVTVESKTQEELDADTNAKAMFIRAERNNLIAQSDWTQLNDAPIDSLKRADWVEYRQALRDIPQQPGFPWDVIWPNQP